MAIENRLVRIEGKLDGLATAHVDIMACLSAQKIAEENHQRNIERFWGQTWPNVVDRLDGNATKIAQIDIKVAELRTKMMIWGCCLTIGVPALATIVQIFNGD